MAFLHRPAANDVKRDVSDYIIKLYLVVERVYEVLDIMGLINVHYPKDGRTPLEFRKSTDGMCAMREVKQWANFIKHPGAFLWCHEPTYWCQSIETPSVDANAVIIDQNIVNKHYTSDAKKHKELYGMIARRDNVYVVFPELVSLTSRFCDGIRDFCDTATSPLFMSFLKQRSTYENYYSYLDGLDDESTV